MKNTINGNTLRGHLETLVLSVLDRAPAHGFEILKRLDDEGSGALHLKEGSLYPALYRLDASKFVKAKWEGESPRRGARRRIYEITPKGKKELAKLRGEWKQFVTIIGRIVEA